LVVEYEAGFKNPESAEFKSRSESELEFVQRMPKSSNIGTPTKTYIYLTISNMTRNDDDIAYQRMKKRHPLKTYHLSQGTGKKSRQLESWAYFTQTLDFQTINHIEKTTN